MTNSLADALSPYLRQHAENPVDWRQWGVEPFEEAARRGVPVFVSIGYSTCHWCHVMARESFSDPAIAKTLNENFVAIKVDREEHPEVDAGYMTAASAFTQNLGWPLNVFTTADGKAFFAGTYWPPDAMAGHPSFRQVLNTIIEAWSNRRGEVEGQANEVADAIRSASSRAVGSLPDTQRLDAAVSLLARSEDTEFGGFGSAPKFPMAPVVDFLLEYGSDAALGLAERALTAMAGSGLRDAVEGGFFRYATRRDWTEPHYERMLYDNAQLLRDYAVLAARVPACRELAVGAASGIVDFFAATLRLPGGGLASAQNSESVVDGHLTEGDYYSLNGTDRRNQTPPALDDKVLTGWNGLAIGALASAGFHLDRADWVAMAIDLADSILASQRLTSGPLVRATLGGKASAARATLEDYGLLARGLLYLAQATGEVRWAIEARGLVDACSAGEGFAVPGGGDPVLAGFGIDPDTDPTEGALPSGNSALAEASRILYLYSGGRRYLDHAEAALKRVAAPAPEQPLAFGSALAAMAALAAEVSQLVVVSDDADVALAAVARTWFSRGGLAAIVSVTQAVEWADAGFELFVARTMQGGKAAAYFCRDFVCRLPVTDAVSLSALLSESARVSDLAGSSSSSG